MPPNSKCAMASFPPPKIPKKSVTFAALAKANNGLIRQTGRGTTGGERTALNKGVGACFVEVEVDTWTGNWRFVRAVYTHDTGLVINPVVSESDMVGSLVESTQVATESIPWDREFPGTRHYSVGYLVLQAPHDHGYSQSRRRSTSTAWSLVGSTA